eukprot:TRINITY_DN32302_c0_g1_i2.p3 TRINITY_DN32302_c0_g1~~TRINITY_DN32302_c0_g1_i2.p3  ORF type:complete len:201 (-),score=-2.93 TRINITY_DN32302_c0_g1_i2:536-1138(-)
MQMILEVDVQEKFQVQVIQVEYQNILHAIFWYENRPQNKTFQTFLVKSRFQAQIPKKIFSHKQYKQNIKISYLPCFDMKIGHKIKFFKIVFFWQKTLLSKMQILTVDVQKKIFIHKYYKQNIKISYMPCFGMKIGHKIKLSLKKFIRKSFIFKIIFMQKDFSGIRCRFYAQMYKKIFRQENKKILYAVLLAFLVQISKLK